MSHVPVLTFVNHASLDTLLFREFVLHVMNHALVRDGLHPKMHQEFAQLFAEMAI